MMMTPEEGNRWKDATKIIASLWKNDCDWEDVELFRAEDWRNIASIAEVSQPCVRTQEIIISIVEEAKRK